METIIIHTNNGEQSKILKAFLKALNITFETRYDPEFVAKIEKSRRQLATGETKAIKTEDLWK
jgi:hypothetical protein